MNVPNIASFEKKVKIYKRIEAVRSQLHYAENSMLLYPPNDVRTKSNGERRFDKAYTLTGIKLMFVT